MEYTVINTINGTVIKTDNYLHAQKIAINELHDCKVWAAIEQQGNIFKICLISDNTK